MIFQFPHLIIYSAKICNLIEWLNRNGKQHGGAETKAFAIFPNIIVFRYKDHPMNDTWLNHEKIHHRQNWESLYISSLIGYFEYWYARLILKYDKNQAYFYKSNEQEAYANMANPHYLDQRLFWGFRWYIKHKPVKGTDENYQTVYTN